MKKLELRQIIKEEIQTFFKKNKKRSLTEGIREDIISQRKIFSDFERNRSRRTYNIEKESISFVNEAGMTKHGVDSAEVKKISEYLSKALTALGSAGKWRDFDKGKNKQIMKMREELYKMLKEIR